MILIKIQVEKNYGNETLGNSDSSEDKISKPLTNLLNPGSVSSSSQNFSSQASSSYDQLQKNYDDGQWSDGEGDISVSPNSSDQESGDSAESPISIRSARAYLRGHKSRNIPGGGQSSLSSNQQSLSRHESHSSMRTVTARENLSLSEALNDRNFTGKNRIGSQQSSRLHSPVSGDRAYDAKNTSSKSRNNLPSVDRISRQTALFETADIRFLENSSVGNKEKEDNYLENGWHELQQELQRFIHNV